jgi:hypothetical protein
VLPIGVEQIPESGLIASGNLFEPFYVKGIVLHTVVSLVKLAIKNNTGQVTVGDTAPKLADIFRTGNFFEKLPGSQRDPLASKQAGLHTKTKGPAQMNERPIERIYSIIQESIISRIPSFLMIIMPCLSSVMPSFNLYV